MQLSATARPARPPHTNRRTFLKAATAGAAGLAAGLPARMPCAAAPAGKDPLPRWRGFNLTNFFQALGDASRSGGVLVEDDLRWMRDWGFDFVRLPMDYWLWIDTDWRKTRKLVPEDTFKIRESMLEKVDRAVDQVIRYGMHVSVNFHRAPGYCINNPEREPFVLWSDPLAEEAFVHHWDVFAKRYRGVSAEQLSFNLVNEAPRPREGYMSREDYARIMTAATRAIRKHNADRLVIVDGLSVGTEVVEELIPLGVAQSVHGYAPGEVSHYLASWVKRKEWDLPTWPVRNKDGSVRFDRRYLERRYQPWGEATRRGVGVHCGEVGCYNKTPYDVFIRWFTDVMEILKGHEIGYALWNFRGAFGVLDSRRSDCAYEEWHGHQLDRRLLRVLQQF